MVDTPLITPESVAQAREALIAQGRKPSQRAIIKHLGGGSFSQVGPLLRELEAGEVPGSEVSEPLTAAITAAVEALWRALGAEADRVVNDARQQFDKDKRKEIEWREAAETKTERTQQQLQTARTRVKQLEKTLAGEQADKERFRREKDALAIDLAATAATLEEKTTRERELQREVGDVTQTLARVRQALSDAQKETVSRIDAYGHELASVRKDSEVKLASQRDALTAAASAIAAFEKEQVTHLRTIANLETVRDGLSQRLESVQAIAVDREGRLRASEASLESSAAMNARLEAVVQEQREMHDALVESLRAQLTAAIAADAEPETEPKKSEEK